MTYRPHCAVPAAVGLAVTIEPAIKGGGDLRIHLTGELDAWSGPTLIRELTGLRPAVRATGQGRSQVVLEMNEVSFLDSSGLIALEESRRGLLAAGWLVTTGPTQPQVSRLLLLAARCGWLTDGPLVEEEPAADAAGREVVYCRDCRRSLLIPPGADDDDLGRLLQGFLVAHHDCCCTITLDVTAVASDH